MTAFLSDGFVAEAARLLAGADPAGDASASIQYVVSGAPDGKVQVAVTIDEGRITAVDSGKVADPDLTVSLAYDEALAIVTGETSADASFMRGAVKVEGAHAVWLLELRELRAAALPVLAGLLD